MPIASPVYHPPGWQSRADRRRAHDQSKVRHYSNARWLRLRAAYLAVNPLCECGCNRPATVVDHRKPHNGDDGLMYAWDNLQAMTKPCHDRKTATQDGGFGRASRASVGAR